MSSWADGFFFLDKFLKQYTRERHLFQYDKSKEGKIKTQTDDGGLIYVNFSPFPAYTHKIHNTEIIDRIDAIVAAKIVVFRFH